MNKPQMKNFKQVKAQDFGATMKKLFKYLKPYYGYMIIAIIMAMIAGVMTVFTPYLTGKILTYFTIYETNLSATVNIVGNWNVDLLGLLGLIVASGILTAVFNYLQSNILTYVSQHMTYNMRVDLAHKMNKLPLKFFDKYQYGEILSRFSNDVDTVNQTLSQGLSEIFRSISVIISIMTIMFVLNWMLALVVTLTVIISLVSSTFFIKISQKYFRQQATHNGRMLGHVEETYHGHQVIKVFNHEKKSHQVFDGINDDIYQTSWKSQFVSSIMNPVQFFFGNLGYIAVVLVGAFGVISGSIVEAGLILTFVQYTRQINMPIQTIGQTASMLQQTAASAERVFEILEATSELDESQKTKKLSQVKGHIEFKDVYFSYVKGEPVIKNFSAAVKPGQTVAIVGPTGAGKTTIVNLLMRFYEIDKGSIEIDDTSVSDMKREDVRNYFGMVLQDAWIFEGTVLENIMYGSPNATFEEVEEASKAAQTYHFIKSLPGGFDFMLNEDGTNISQGQRQLITISRAMLANRPMLILDEATSSVDTRTEILIQKAMDTLMKNRTSFVIAHRLSTIKNADVIFVMKQGNIIEQGNHEALLQQNGFYAQLYNSQFEQ